jgi:hypothetical protein
MVRRVALRVVLPSGADRSALRSSRSRRTRPRRSDAVPRRSGGAVALRSRDSRRACSAVGVRRPATCGRSADLGRPGGHPRRCSRAAHRCRRAVSRGDRGGPRPRCSRVRSFRPSLGPAKPEPQGLLERVVHVDAASGWLVQLESDTAARACYTSGCRGVACAARAQRARSQVPRALREPPEPGLGKGVLPDGYEDRGLGRCPA